MANTTGKLFTLTTFGESHGEAIGGVIDGFPSNIEIDIAFVQSELNRRRPGQSSITTPRNESDTIVFLSGIFEGKSTGAPIGFMIKNENQHSKDYDHLKNVYRPSHADYTYQRKYGNRDHRGGGRSSNRESASWVVAGALAKLALKKYSVDITAFVSQIGGISYEHNWNAALSKELIEASIVRCPDNSIAQQMIALVKTTGENGNSIGGCVSCMIAGLPVGLGEPVFDKLHASLAKAMMTINATKGFEYGSGFKAAEKLGSEHNDSFVTTNGNVHTKTNQSGGIQGGISNGEPIYFNVAFKPVATIKINQDTIDKEGNAIQLAAEGRHDPCVVPRAVAIVEAMAAITLLDQLLVWRAYKEF